MAKFSCVWRNNNGEHIGESVEIDAKSAQEAFNMFIEAERKDKDDLYSNVSVYEFNTGYFSVFGTGEDEKAAVRNSAVAAKKQAEANQTAQSSLSSTDILLKELIREQKQTNEWLKKVRWSLLMIHIIMVLWYVFGWVIFPI